jgi:hypothetical protein
LSYADDVHIVGDNTDTIKKNTEAFLHASKDFVLEVNPEKTKYMLMSRSQKIRQKYSIKRGNRSFEEVAEFKYLGTALTDQNHMDKEIKSRQNSGNNSYHSVQSLLTSLLMSRNLKVIICKTILLSVVLYGCEIWSVILREGRSFTGFEKSVLKRIFGPHRDEVTGEWRKLHNGEHHNLHSSSDVIRQIKKGE